MKRTFIFVLIFIGSAFFIVVLLLGLAFFWLDRSPRGPESKATNISSGTLGKWNFSSAAEVKAFNSEIAAWPSGWGYARSTNETFDAIAGSDEWKMPGLLLNRRENPTNQSWIFIPENYRTNGYTQLVGYHLSWEGSAEEVKRRQAGFASTRAAFQREFPDTWNPGQDLGAEPGTPAGGRHPGSLETN